jgi:hypothetical protein
MREYKMVFIVLRASLTYRKEWEDSVPSRANDTDLSRISGGIKEY